MNLRKLKIGDVAPNPPLPKSEKEITDNWQGSLSMPLVSIICYVYNHVNYIEDALNSFLMQKTDFPFEIIIHDDASNDGSTEIIEKYSKLYPNIIFPIIQSENQWNKGIMPRNFTYPKIRGKYLAICEGDDYWLNSHKLSNQVNSFAPGISIVFHNAIRIENDIIIDDSYYLEKEKPLDGYNAYQMVRGSKIPTASALMRAKPILSINHLPNIINGDHFLWAVLASEGKAKFIDDTWSIYRHHVGGVWSNRKTLDKVQPTLKSRETIFNCVPPEFKATALLAYVQACQLLVLDLINEGYIQEAKNLTKQSIIDSYKMSKKSLLISSSSNLIEHLRVQKTTIKTIASLIKANWKQRV